MDISLIIKCGVVVAAIGLGFGIKYITSSQTIDQTVEKVAEEVIKDETGATIEFQDNNK